MMSKFLTAAIFLVGSSAFAGTVSVEFQKCTMDQYDICAKVFSSESPSGQEMRITVAQDADPNLESQVKQSMAQLGHSLAMNVEGEIVLKHNSFGGSLSPVLILKSLKSANESASRPREL